MATFAKPENALKRAEEFINVGQKQDALQTLHDLIITSKRYKAWEKTLEKIMFKFMDLCVDLKSARFAKDGLIQYRIVCQQVNVSSLEEVIKHFLDLATEKAEQADALEEALHVVDEELEADVKFMWETYRTVLEILRHNSKLEALYAVTAHKALQFCKKYKRPTEFHRLCEMIRNHNKYRDQRDRPDLSAPESFQLCLDTRFDQFKVATELGLWQEAFRSVEDIHGLMCMVKEMPKSSLLMLYYSKLTEIFWISSSHLYHAYAWFKLFTLQNKNLSQKDLQLIASSLVLAALSIPPFGRVQENEKECDLRMANLIGFDLEPKLDMLSRSALVSELVSRGVLSCESQEVQDLFNVLEDEFHPLDLGFKIQPLLEKISKSGGKLSSAPCLPQVQLSQYLPFLEKLATLRLLQHVSKIYQTIRIESLCQLVPFFEISVVEKIAVDAFVAMKVDHMKGVVVFGNLGVESDVVKDHLDVFAESLSKVRAMLYPPVPSKASKLGGRVADTVEKEHKRLVARKSIIEKRKEDQERQQLEMEREEEQKRLQLHKLTVEAEQKRLAAELEERMRQRILKETEERELEEAKALLEETEKRMRKGKKKTLLDGEEMVTKQTVMESIFTAKVKKRQEMEKKLENLAKTMDYLERAKREEAAPLIEAAYQRRLIEEREFYEGELEREVEVSKERHESDLKEKKRLFRMLDDKEIFQASCLTLRQH